MNRDALDYGEIDALVRSAGRAPNRVVSILHAVQKRYRYLPAAVLEYLADSHGISPRAIAGVSSFYSLFRFKPAGRHFIKVCVGTACHVKGAEALVEDFRGSLEIPEGEDTDPDRLFTVSRVACLGCCMLAPAVQIDDVTYGPVSSARIPSILADFLNSFSTHGNEPDAGGVSADPSATVRICLCSSCSAAGSGEVADTLRGFAAKRRLDIRVTNVGCTGISFEAPLVEFETRGGETFRYGRVFPADVSRILDHHFRPKTISLRVRNAVRSLLERLYEGESFVPVTRYRLDRRDRGIEEYLDRQTLVATRGAGEADPLDFEEYRRREGFKALVECRRENDPGRVIRAVEESGLRGRGGAGYPTALKWRAVRDSGAGERYLICNGDEGDPGAFMDRMLMESFPFRVIEGMAIAAFACGIRKGFFFIRAEYPLAVSRIRSALGICVEKGLLGENLELEVVVSAGAFVCGEETAMIAAMHGERGTPSYRPPYPSERGYLGRSTLINNVETFALVPWILREGASSFSKLGTRTSPGTKTFALAGKINRGGLIEVEMGTTLEEIVWKIGGGIKDGRRLKAVQIGGPAGGCVPADRIRTPVDYEHLKALGTIMGSGGMVVLDDEDCMVDVALFFMRFTRQESCGKCTFGRVGTLRMMEILEKLTRGEACADDLERLGDLGRAVRRHSLCGLGRAAPNPVLSALEYFGEEFVRHTQGICPAMKCRALIDYRIDDHCIGCTRCAQRCPADAIEPRPYRRHEIDLERCVRCDTCRRVCPVEAVCREPRGKERSGP